MYEAPKKDVLQKIVKAAKMQDAGHSVKQEGISLKPMKPTDKIYPTLHLCGKEAAFLKDCPVGGKETLVIEAILRSKSSSEHVNGSDHSDYSLEIRKIGKL